MTDIDGALAEGTWDLGEVLQERTQPTSAVDLYLDEAASYTKKQLTDVLKDTDDAKVQEIQKALDEVDKLLQKSHYIVHLRGVPTRMREDIRSKSMHEYPMKLDIMGRDDPNNAVDRQRYENVSTWFAQISGIEKPGSGIQTFQSREQVDEFSKNLPATAYDFINKSIADLTIASEAFTAASRSIDF